MKVFQVGMSFFPTRGGGETYVGALAKSLLKRGVQVLVVAPGLRGERYFHEGIEVQKIPVAINSELPLRQLYDGGDDEFIRRFEDLLLYEKPDLVHLHARTPALSWHLVRTIKERGIPVVFTYHIATVSCPRGNLMRWGDQVCNGLLDLGICTPCFLHAHGLPREIALWIGRVPIGVGRALGRTTLRGRVVTALRMQELMAVAHASIRAFFGECDRIVTLCQWATSVLLRNGIPPDKVILCRIGLPDEASVLLSKQTAHLEKTEGPLRCVFLGGLRPEKGLHILIQSVASAPALPVELHIHGRTVNAAEDRYVQTLRALAQGDPRIHFHGPIPDREVVRCLREYDVAIVPSQCLETGPFVVLEAFAAGLPVVGSNLGGIAELVRDGIDGLLVEPTSLQKWQNALTQLASDRTVLDRLRSQVRVSRTMADVAAEMEALYQSLLTESSIA